jgi:proteasome lid subunit RPN8/RPN11
MIEEPRIQRIGAGKKRLPRIVAEFKKETKNVPPPKLYRLHEWNVPPSELTLYVADQALQKMIKHCLDYADQRLEVMGFLVGDRYTWNGVEYCIVRDVVTTDLDATAISVKFDRAGFSKLFERLDKLGPDYILVGWYHSHPGHTCFLSATDISTQRRMFNQPYHTAIVVDPIHREMKAFKVVDNNFYEKSFVVYHEEEKLEPPAPLSPPPQEVQLPQESSRRVKQKVKRKIIKRPLRVRTITRTRRIYITP